MASEEENSTPFKEKEEEGKSDGRSSRASSTKGDNLGVFLQRTLYLGSTSINAPRSENEINRNMEIMNRQTSKAIEVILSVPATSEGTVYIYEAPSLLSPDPIQPQEGGDQSDNIQNTIGSFEIPRIIFCARGKMESNERNCFAFTCSHGTNFENGLLQCHVFRCDTPETVLKILQSFNSAFRRASISTEFVNTFDVTLEMKEEDPNKPNSLTSCTREKDCFKLRCNLEKKFFLTIQQDLSRSKSELLIERCFGILLSPGRNVKSSDMLPIGLISMTKQLVNASTVITADNYNRIKVNMYQIIGSWNPTEPLFEVLNTETPQDTRVYFTIAFDLIIQGIREPVRFVLENKAKIVGYNENRVQWLPMNLPAISGKNKSFNEHYYLKMREKATPEPDSKYDVISCLSATQISQRKFRLNLDLGQKQPKEKVNTPTLEESDSDEPLLSGSGEVSKDCSITELNGWAEVLNKWRTNLSQRPKSLSSFVRKGIPEALRGEVWQLLAKCHNDEGLMDTYRLLINRESSSEKIIQRDINRTFPAHDFFREVGSLGQDSLYKLCKAYSVFDEEIGYCQGFSFLAAAILLHMPEEQAFCVLVKIMYDYGLRGLFRCGFEELHLRFYQLQRLIEDQIPEIYSHFIDLGIEIHMFASQWFLTLFTAKFPLHVVFYILDIFLLDGMETIFKVALALLQLSRKEILAHDFEGVLKHFRIQLPKKYRSEENGRLLLRTAVNTKVKKLAKYEKEYEILKEENKQREDPLDRLSRDNSRLNESNMRLEQENDDLAHELVNSKIQLRKDLDIAEDKVDVLNKELLSTKSTLVDYEEEKKLLEAEVNQLKEMCRRELQRAETEITRNEKIIADYKQICSQLSTRLEKEQVNSKETIERIMSKVSECESCSRLFKNQASSESSKDETSHNEEMNGSKGENEGGSKNKRIRELELELAETKLALVQSECKNQDLVHQINASQAEIQASKNSWFNKTLTSIREATKKELNKTPSENSISRENSKDFT